MAGTPPGDKLKQLEDDVRAARSDLASTVDELAGWFEPKTRMTAAMDRGRRLLHDASDSAADPADRRRARIVLGVAAAVTAVMLSGVVRRLSRH